MFKEMSKFQLVLIGLFAFFIVAGLAAFSLIKGNSKAEPPTIVIWGTLDNATFGYYTQQMALQSGNQYNISYVQKAAENFDSALLEALAIGAGPDAIVASQSSLLKHANKITIIPYETFSDGNFKSTFVQEAELFLTQNGILAMPFSIDPMVMYWNRDIFTNANLSLPPKHWDEFRTIVPRLTKKDASLNITQSAVALGEYQNISYAKDILSVLILQAGNPIVVKSSTGLDSSFAATFNNAIAPANSALTFYTQFADPQKEAYTWNRALPNSKMLFLSGKLGIYFGYASEYKELREKNPYLNFDVTYVPQLRPQQGAQLVSTTFGKMHGIAILKASGANTTNTYGAISLLTSQAGFNLWSQISGLPAVRRDALTSKANDASSVVFANSVLWSRGWLDPDHYQTESIYRNMIESVTSGRAFYGDAVVTADQRIQNLLQQVSTR
jgi:ABC-type glycerol-3-phosphate transport system substrate-binding protein